MNTSSCFLQHISSLHLQLPIPKDALGEPTEPVAGAREAGQMQTTEILTASDPQHRYGPPWDSAGKALEVTTTLSWHEMKPVKMKKNDDDEGDDNLVMTWTLSFQNHIGSRVMHQSQHREQWVRHALCSQGASRPRGKAKQENTQDRTSGQSLVSWSLW